MGRKPVNMKLKQAYIKLILEYGQNALRLSITDVIRASNLPPSHWQRIKHFHHKYPDLFEIEAKLKLKSPELQKEYEDWLNTFVQNFDTIEYLEALDSKSLAKIQKMKRLVETIAQEEHFPS